MNGYNNHSDFQDIHFDFNQGWIVRKPVQYIQYGAVPWYEDLGVNHGFTMKIKFRKVNHWNAGSDDFRAYEYGPKANQGTYFARARFNKWNYAANTRLLYEFPGQGGWWMCAWGITPSNELGESVETAFQVHNLRPEWYRTRSEYRMTCGLTQVTTTRQYSTGYAGYVNGEYRHGNYERVHALDITDTTRNMYPTSPFQGALSNGYGFMQYLIREIIITTGTAHTSPSFFTRAQSCKPDALQTYGFDTVDQSVECTAGYSPYHEAGRCIAPTPTADFMDCAHDMNTVDSKCYRCKRYYGKSGNDGCFKCFSNCLSCVGPNSDQCTYCGMGYGFTGISCKICGDDETWDLTKNLCQLKKQLNLEMDAELDSFGQVQLLFIPLNGYADLSLYYEYMFDKFWLIDINRNYQLSRTYTNIPLHRKVSISFELMSIDTRHFDQMSFSVDKVFVAFFQWNLEDIDMNCTTSFWGYGYKDMLPSKFSYTLFHSANTMTFDMKPYFGNDWATIWIRELNVTFFGCFESCATCWEDNSPVHCLTCLDGYYFTNFQCKACSSSCSKCVNDPFTCTGCPTTQVLLGANCIAGCGLGYFSDTNGVCQTCPSTCIQCNSLTSCITCVNGNYLNGASMCVACAGSCKTCQGTSTTCLSCNGVLLLQSGTCVASCSSGYFLTGTTCQACPNGCTTCDSSTCLTCSPGYRFRGNICVNPCGDGYYASSATQCLACSSTCATCSSSPACDTCKPGYVQSGTSCLPCQSPCTTCVTTVSTCTSCQPGSSYYLQYGGGSCVSASLCASGSYAETNNQCMACASQCATCVDTSDKCLSCSDSSKVWKHYACFDACTTGYANIGGLCCPDKCTACNQSEACSGCVSGYYLDSLFRCIECDSNCLTCTTTATNCLTCPSGKVFQQGVCQDACNQKFYNDGGICKACHSSCLYCIGPADTQCTTCDNLHFFWKGLCYSCRNDQANFDNSRFEEKGGRCWEKCGVGGKLSIVDIPEGLGGYKACDDGNLVNGDGCTSSCTVERNFNCIGGGESKKDFCYTLKKPVADIIPINNNDRFQISFSKMVNFKNITDPNGNVPFPISILIKGVDSSLYTITWEKPSTSQFDYINFTINAKETILNGKGTLYFERAYISDEFNNTLTTIKLNFNFTLYVDKRFVFEPVYKGLEITNEVSTILIPVSSLGITNYILQNFIRYMTTFQIIGGGIFYNVDQTSTIKTFLTSANNATTTILPGPMPLMKSKIIVSSNSNYLDPKIKTYNRILLSTSSVNTDTSAVTNTSSYSALYDTTNAATPFKRNGYTNSMIPNLGFSIIIIIITGTWYFLASAFLFGKVTIKSGFCKRFLAFNAERGFYTSMMFGSLELTIFATNNIVNPKFSHIGHILSFILAMITMLVMISLPIILYSIANHEVMTLWNPEYYDRYGFIYCEFKLNTKPRKAFMSILLTRIILFGILLAALAKYPIPQTVAVLMVHMAYFSSLVKIKPFVSMTMFVITVCAGSIPLFRILRVRICFMLRAECTR